MNATRSTDFEYDFFISRTSSDRQWAEWVAWHLEEIEIEPGRKCRVLLQDWDFLPGSDWLVRMEDGVKLAERLIVIVSSNYLERSDFGKAEWLSFWRQDPASRQQRTIPIRVEDCSVEGLLGSIVYLDLANVAEDEAERRLWQLVNSNTSGRNKPATAPIWPGKKSSESTSRPEVESGHVGKARALAQGVNELHWLNSRVANVYWPHSLLPSANFVGRSTQISRLDRWATESAVKLIGVAAMGGTGKTALINEWLRRGSAVSEKTVQGVFGWSFYEERHGDRWEERLLDWLATQFGLEVTESLPVEKRVVAAVAAAPPLIIFLDGLEVRQSAPNDAMYGQFLDGRMREILVTLCQVKSKCLIILTSRFSFADLEMFVGSSVRMLEVSRLSATDGAELLDAAGVGWIPEPERRRLVDSVEGHALAVTVLGAALQTRPSNAEMSMLWKDLAGSGPLSRRVSRLLEFYSRTLAPSDRKLIAIVSLFVRPIEIDVIRSLGATLRNVEPTVDWSRSEIRDAVRQRLSGLLTWHTSGAVSAHPFIRDHFRPYILSPDVAMSVSDTALADLPAGSATSLGEAERVVEIIELLLDANLWEDANRLYENRTENGWLFLRLPAARLGLRAAIAFVERRYEELSISALRINFYLSEAGLFASKAGDMQTAVKMLREAARNYEAQRNDFARAIVLRNLARCMIATGNVEDAVSIASEALLLTKREFNVRERINAVVLLAHGNYLVGNTAIADKFFIEANHLERTGGDSESGVLYSGNGVIWSEFLLRTGRREVGREQLRKNRVICLSQGWRADVARCDTVLSRCDLDDGLASVAVGNITSAIETFRSGEMLPELAQSLLVEAECLRITGDLDAADRACVDALSIAGSRKLLAVHVGAIVTRSKIRIDRYCQTKRLGDLENAQDDLEQAERLATRLHRLPWSELSVLDARVYVNHIIGDKQAMLEASVIRDELYHELIPEGLR